MKPLRTAFLLAPLWLCAPAAHADVVRCTDARGATVYTDGACPSGSKSAQPVQILEAPPPDPSARADVTPPPPSAPAAKAPAPARPVANSRPQGPAVIPRYPDEQVAQEPQPDPAYGWNDGYGYPYPPARRARIPPTIALDPPPGHRQCPNLSGLKRYNC